MFPLTDTSVLNRQPARPGEETARERAERAGLQSRQRSHEAERAAERAERAAERAAQRELARWLSEYHRPKRSRIICNLVLTIDRVISESSDRIVSIDIDDIFHKLCGLVFNMRTFLIIANIALIITTVIMCMGAVAHTLP